MNDLELLIIRINRTNSETPFEVATLSEVITKQDCLKSKIRAYRDLQEAASISQERYSNKEIRFIRCVDVIKLQEKIGHLSKLYREIDTRIQERNWTVDLIG